MPIVSVKITGRQQLLAAIQEANKRLEAATESVLDSTANDVQADMQSNAPVRTGRLRNSIAIKKSKLRRVIGTDVPYSKYIELGTYKMKAQPFAFPASEKNRQGFIRNIQAIKV
jgi:HK97 gp10 family phage protein